MNIIWSSIAIVLLALAGGVAVAGGEPAMAELRLAEAATKAAVAGIAAVCDDLRNGAGTRGHHW